MYGKHNKSYILFYDFHTGKILQIECPWRGETLRLEMEVKKHETSAEIKDIVHSRNARYHSAQRRELFDRCPKSLEPMVILIPHRWIGRRGPVAWAPRSPDLNFLDFVFWGFLKAQVYAVKIRYLRHLRQRITDCCATVDPSMFSKICTNMVKRLRKCVECRSEHIEHIM
jgi:hypothetical protein